jgi:hypothetical protein
LKVDDKTVVRVVWSRGKKSAKTHSKTLSTTLDKAIFDEKFQINTILELDSETGYPVAEKIGKMTVCMDKSMGGTELCEVSFNMADFKFDEYKIVRLNMQQCAGNDVLAINSDETFLDIGLKGKRAQGLLQASMKKSSSNKTLPPLSRSLTNINQAQRASDTNIDMPQLIIEIDLLKKDIKAKKKDYDRNIVSKNTKINDLMTELENTKTDLNYTSKKLKNCQMLKES